MSFIFVFISILDANYSSDLKQVFTFDLFCQVQISKMEWQIKCIADQWRHQSSGGLTNGQRDKLNTPFLGHLISHFFQLKDALFRQMSQVKIV